MKERQLVKEQEEEGKKEEQERLEKAGVREDYDLEER